VTERERQESLAEARFTNVHVELGIESLVLYAGERAA